MYARVLMYMYAYALMHMYANALMHIYVDVRMCMYAFISMYMEAGSKALLGFTDIWRDEKAKASTSTYKPTYIHTYIQLQETRLY